jgi:hypothetical protein
VCACVCESRVFGAAIDFDCKSTSKKVDRSDLRLAGFNSSVTPGTRPAGSASNPGAMGGTGDGLGVGVQRIP